MIVVEADRQSLHPRHVLLLEGVIGVEERSLLQTLEVGDEETLIRSIVRRLEVRREGDMDEGRQAPQQVIVGVVVRSHNE